MDRRRSIESGPLRDINFSEAVEETAMEKESALTSNAADSMAETLKEVVRGTSNWMRSVQSLPIEEAEAEYAQSSVEGDLVLQQLQHSYEEALENNIYLDEWAVRTRSELWGPMMKRPTAVEMLMVKVLDMMTGFRFLNEVKFCEVLDFSELPTLRHCAYSPDIRFLASCGFPSSRWTEVMEFRTGIEAARYFAEQCDFFNHRIQATGIERPYLSEDCAPGKNPNQNRNYTFSDILEMCRSDREEAQDCLFPCVCIDHLDTLIDYEVAWIKHAFCRMPEPRPWALEKEQWLTDRHPERESQTEGRSDVPSLPRTPDGLLGMMVVDTAEEISITRFVRHLGRRCNCRLTEDNQKAVFRKLIEQNGRIKKKEFLTLVQGRSQQNNARARLRAELEKIQIQLSLVGGEYVLEACE